MRTKEEIEQLANDYGKSVGNTDGTTAFDFKLGYSQCQRDMADEKYTEEDMKKCWNACYDFNKPAGLDSGINYQDYINSLNKQD